MFFGCWEYLFGVIIGILKVDNIFIILKIRILNFRDSYFFKLYNLLSVKIGIRFGVFVIII